MLRNRKTLQASEHWGDDDQLGVRDLAQPSWDVPRKMCRRREREDFYFSFPICGCCCWCCCWENLIGRLKNLLVSLHVEISNRCQPVHVDHGSLTQRSLPKIIREKKSFFSSSSSFYHSCRFILIRWETTSLQHYIAVVSVNVFRFLPHHFLLLFLFPFDQKKKKRRTAGRAGLRLSRLLIFAPCWGPAFAVVVMGPGKSGHYYHDRERERG